MSASVFHCIYLASYTLLFFLFFLVFVFLLTLLKRRRVFVQDDNPMPSCPEKRYPYHYVSILLKFGNALGGERGDSSSSSASSGSSSHGERQWTKQRLTQASGQVRN